MAETMIAMDLGTEHIRLCETTQDDIFIEKNVIAIKNRTDVVGIGEEAYDMYEKTPDSFDILFPVREGVIADFHAMNEILRYYITQNFATRRGKYSAMIAVPNEVTDVEKRAFYEAVQSGSQQYEHVLICEKPIATAVGLGLPVETATSLCVVDFGAGTTEITILSMGRIVISRLLPIGSRHLAQSIVSYLRRKQNLHIGEKTALAILEEIGSAVKPDPGIEIPVVGVNLSTGYPVSKQISAQMVYEAIIDQLKKIMDVLVFILVRTPPELTANIKNSGIWLTGGMSNLHQIGQLVSSATKRMVYISDSPYEDVTKGLKRIATDPALGALMPVEKGKRR